ncbi:MAG: PAS domain-containing protein, partial [Spirochaetes bacterium]|nr:PAS domain-containing protein [Spirochaetota bacterium]
MKITDRLLSRYNESDYMIWQKARFLFFVYAVLIISILCIMAYTTYFHLNNPLRNFAVDQRMLGVTGGALLLVILCLATLVRGHFAVAAHGTLLGLFIALWSAMVLDRTEVVSRLDTIVLVLAVLSSLPLLISRRRSAVVLYSGLNLAAFYAYMFYLRGDLGLSETAFFSHLADNTLAFLFIGIISYNIFSINNRSLEQVEESNVNLRRANIEIQAAMEEMEATNEEFEAQNEELLRSEEELKRNTIFIRRIVENAPAVINRYSLIENRFEFVSPRVRDMGGYSPEEFYSDPDILKKFVHPDWFDRVMKWWGGLIRGTSSPTYEYQIRKKDGTILWIREHSQLIKDDAGRPIAVEGFSIDIDDIRKSETKLKESEEKYRGLVENINDIIFTADAQGRITYLSPSVGRYGDFGADDFIGKSMLDVIHPEDREKLVQRFGELSEGGLAPSEYRIVFPPGQFRWARVSTRPVFVDGAFAGASGVISDIHER